MKMYFPNEQPLASKEWSLDWLIKPCEHAQYKDDELQDSTGCLRCSLKFWTKQIFIYTRH